MIRRWGPRIAEVRVELEGRELGRLRVDEERSDVASFVGDAYARAGWSGRLPLAEADEVLSSWLGLRGVDEAGETVELWGGSLATALLEMSESKLQWTQRVVEDTRAELGEVRRDAAELNAEVGRVTERLSRIEASRVWRARNAWRRLFPRS